MEWFEMPPLESDPLSRVKETEEMKCVLGHCEI